MRSLSNRNIFSHTSGGSVQLSCSLVSDCLWPHWLQHTRLPCPSPTPRAHSNSCPSSQLCHPTISSSVVPFSSYLQSFPASESFPMRRLESPKLLEVKSPKSRDDAPLTRRGITPILASIVTQCAPSMSVSVSSLFLIRSQSCWSRIHTNDFFLPWLHLPRPYFQMRSYSQVPRTRILLYSTSNSLDMGCLVILWLQQHS